MNKINENKNEQGYIFQSWGDIALFYIYLFLMLKKMKKLPFVGMINFELFEKWHGAMNEGFL